jgi:hypothetical protein
MGQILPSLLPCQEVFGWRDAICIGGHHVNKFLLNCRQNSGSLKECWLMEFPQRMRELVLRS